MRIVIAAVAALLLLGAGPLFAQAPPVTPICNGAPCGTAANPEAAQIGTGTSLIGSTITWKRVDVTPTVQNAAYASGNDIGGLVAFTLDRTASGFLQSVAIQFVGGATTTITAYCFDANPTGSTFTDKSTFSIAVADEAKRINKVGIALTPAAATGDTVTAAALDNYAQPFNSTATIWCAFVGGGTFTPASATDMRVAIRVGQGAL